MVKHECGVIRVAGSRVSLDSVLYAFLEGSTPGEIVLQYPSLQLADDSGLLPAEPRGVGRIHVRP